MIKCKYVRGGEATAVPIYRSDSDFPKADRRDQTDRAFRTRALCVNLNATVTIISPENYKPKGEVF